ncbi:Thioredoxin reductase [Paenibacillus sp. UNCCL117]|uniref:NAD(P)/FAD-dependent oxidoreductase n=1 Tax=unclassified Paenibacillus TaxID=185978 RepID=UPI00087E1EF2|nr:MULTISPECIES: NAD(P)/FAD-dependent oxidoreductase [unclassified Paenibacillus]SDD12500.1 Thioredoxin reductase [Paenibacillus sp. cl123]SFW33802.1 Thioredoxin reductase [Paenibacillus sp. UNCCL117]
MLVDCAIIGGGPAGMNAALVLGRAGRTVVLFDDNTPRNAVTRASHGFITRDGITPDEFRLAACRDIGRYPSVAYRRERVVSVNRTTCFGLQTERGEWYAARTLLLATGLREKLPAVPGIRNYYGISLFSCPYCDGWERRGEPLVVISEYPQALQLARTVRHWSRDLVVCTNGRNSLTDSDRQALGSRGIGVYEQPIHSLVGEGGRLRSIRLEDGTELRRTGGFVATSWYQAAPFGEAMGCRLNPQGGLATDSFGRTSAAGVYAAGDICALSPSQLIMAAADGARAAIGINSDLIQADW